MDVHHTDSNLDLFLPKPAPVVTGALASPTRDSTTESDGEHSANETEGISRDPSVTPPSSVLAKRARGNETPSRRVAPRADDAGADEADGGASGRKIWMRPCNECGFELHVRRTKCTECGALQMSKRAAASAKEEEERRVLAAHDAARLQQEAEAAASQLALICEGAGRDATAPDAPPDAPAAPAAAAAPAASAPPANRARPDAAALAKAVDGLSPEALLKLRRMQKLRALLNRVPSDVRQELRGRRAHNLGAAADAISMLASVATTM